MLLSVFVFALSKLWKPRKIWGSHSGTDKDSIILGCDAVSTAQ
jgi:hypothetical protein